MRELLHRFSEVRVLVAGDCMLDRYVEGAVTRISPEAPVPIVAVAREHACLGGAANVAAGTAALSCKTELAGVIGADMEGDQIRGLAGRAGIGIQHMIVEPSQRTICKTRVLGDRGQQLLRLDQDGPRESREGHAETLTGRLLGAAADCQVVVLADYEKGTLPTNLIRSLVRHCAENSIPVLVDPKKADVEVYAGATVITPNHAELEQAVRRKLESEAEVAAAAQELRRHHDFQFVLATRGADGMCLVGAEGAVNIPAHVRNVADVAGAGDTVVAMLAACIGSGMSMVDACRMASFSAGIAVAQPRVYVVGKNDLERAQRPCSTKIISIERAAALGHALREQGRKIVLTNGCFDILHAGHLASLLEAKTLGDELIVGLNSDASVTRFKGPSRPKIALEHRAALLAGLSCVDWIIPFDEDSPLGLVAALRPDFLVKGGDYRAEEIVGATIVQAYGGQVVATSYVDGLSSTRIIGR